MFDPGTAVERILRVCLENHNQVALKMGDQEFSYQQLDLLSGNFARYLISYGVGRGGCVAICFARSPLWVVAALGIMRAGAAYVPLDITWPNSRLDHAIEDSNSKFVVGGSGIAGRLKSNVRVIDPEPFTKATFSAPPLRMPSPSADDLAYVMYTSGSTGLPKGVEITHANLSHLIRWHSEAFSIDEEDRVSHLAGLGFDAAVWELWPNLCCGATICMADDDTRLSPLLLQRWLLGEKISVTFVPTVHAGPLMRLDWPVETKLRLMLTGGEALSQHPPGNLPFAVVNNYGPTECTVVATSATVRPGGLGKPPIGLPIGGTSVYLLDETGHPVPHGSMGEIYLGGDGVGRGYRDLPETTAISFLPDPFAKGIYSRMYRTGDLGRWRPDLQLEFCGRVDRQVKIRGQRVELEGVEVALSSHPDVCFAATVLMTLENEEDRLVAYVMLRQDSVDVTANTLQSYLLRSLPDYMIPSTFVHLREIPTTPNGKLDSARLALPTAENSLKSSATHEYHSVVEERLIGIVRELLHKSDVTVEDNFFLAGGHSLMGMQLAMSLRRAFGVDLTLRQILGAPNVKSLAKALEKKMIEDVTSISDETAQAFLKH